MRIARGEQVIDRGQGRFGLMVVIATDQGAGRLYRCPCGWQGWSAWGHAIRHVQSCPKAKE